MIIDPHAVAAAAALLKPVVRELGIGSRTEPAQLDLNAVSETAHRTTDPAIRPVRAKNSVRTVA